MLMKKCWFVVVIPFSGKEDVMPMLAALLLYLQLLFVATTIPWSPKLVNASNEEAIDKA